MERMRDGSTVEDTRLGRLVQFDERSRGFPVAATVTGKKPRSYTWRCSTFLDQGREGACVGFTMAHELAARPVPVAGVTAAQAQAIYREAQKIDPWPGENYEGTSTLAGIKILQRQGHITEYRWAFSLEELVLAVGYRGPCAIGVNWYQGMFSPDQLGFLRPVGRLAGGHCTLVYSVNVREEFVRIHNSWGQDWGDGGTAKIRFADLARLLGEDGEAVFPTARARP